MRLAHIYDHTYYRRGEDIFSSGAFAAESWDRYLRHFDQLTVIANLGRNPPNLNKLNRVNHPQVEFQFVANARSLQPYLKQLVGMDGELTAIIEAHDAIAVRLPSEMGLTAIRIAARIGKPWAVELVGCCWDGYRNHGTLKGKLLAPITFRRTKAAVRRSPHVISVTERFLQGRYPGSGHVANASNVMVEVDRTGQVLARRLEKIRAGRGKLNVGLIASLDVRFKGHEELVRAISSLGPDEQRRIRCHFVGPGEGKWLRKLITELKPSAEFVYHGKLPSGQPVLDFLNELDLYVHPSKKEGLPRVIIEAMSRGLPVLASSTAGTPELLRVEFLHTPGDADRLAEQLRAALVAEPAWFAERARENFGVAQRYDHRVLRQARDQFWGAFAQTARRG